MNTEEFYSDLKVFDDFSVVSELSSYTKIPSDWYIVVADVENSTIAIKNGLYKSVNIIGVSVITSIRNATKPLLLPYIFGGDGASMCIPPTVLTKAKQALIATSEMSEKQFGLKLRIGIIPVSDILDEGHQVLVTKHRMSEHYIQAAFSGGGVEYAESLIKDENKKEKYSLKGDSDITNADYSGLECRWDNVYSQHGETIALIVKALPSSMEEQSIIYNEIIGKIKQIYGDDELCNPVQIKALNLTNNNKKLSHELKVKTYLQDKSSLIKYWFKIRLENLLGWIFMTFKLNLGGNAWGEYKTDVVKNTDFKKFDGVLRQVISGKKEQRIELIDYLKQCHKNNQCVYGIHVSDSALVTCMINNRSGEHFHFVDGADGGYAMAATEMKQQLNKFYE
jgi:hypothetical protein